jgi:predicted transglutaminase-like cysteine proteinase
LRCVWLLALLLTAFADPAAADSIDGLLTGKVATPRPLGRIIFCREHVKLCSGLAQTKPLPATSELMTLLAQVNVAVNHAITYQREVPVRMPVENRPGKFVMVERWEINPKVGDCEDFSVSKMVALMKAGLPRSALRFAVYRLPDGTPHAVLTVETTDGTLVLSNLSDRVMPWREITDARWVGVERVSPQGFMGFWELRK